MASRPIWGGLPTLSPTSALVSVARLTVTHGGTTLASVTPRRRSNGTISWRVQYRVDGSMRQESFPDETGAIKFGQLVDRVGGAAARRVLAARASSDAGAPTLAAWTEQYLDPDSGLLTGVDSSTRREYGRIAAKSFLPILGELPVDAIQKADVGRWATWQEQQPSLRRRGQNVSAKTVRNYHALLSSILTAAVEARHIDANPAHKTRMTRGQKHDGVFLSRSEFATLLHFIPEHYKPLVLLLAGTGARWGEATALDWRDLNLHATPPTIRIHKAWKKSGILAHPKTSRSVRTVSLWPELVDALGTPGQGKALMFTGPEGVGRVWPGRFRSSVWMQATALAMDEDACAAAGLEPIAKRPRVHDLRHTHASWLIAAGMPLPYVQARLGHESITTTINVYGHLLPDAHVAMSEVMADTMSAVLAPRLELGA